LRDIGWTVGDGTEEAGVDVGDDGVDEDTSLIVNKGSRVDIKLNGG
jgi:hypothetical protein